MNVKSFCDIDTYQKGLRYFNEGRITSFRKNGNDYYCEIIGSKTYHVFVRITGENDFSYNCGCPFYQNRKKMCKHVVALLIFLDRNNMFKYEPDCSSTNTVNDNVDEIDEVDPTGYYLDATNGDYEAMENYACCLENGDGVPEDREEAFRWFEKAMASKKCKYSAYSVALELYRGEIVEKDLNKAFTILQDLVCDSEYGKSATDSILKIIEEEFFGIEKRNLIASLKAIVLYRAMSENAEIPNYLKYPYITSLKIFYEQRKIAIFSGIFDDLKSLTSGRVALYLNFCINEEQTIAENVGSVIAFAIKIKPSLKINCNADDVEKLMEFYDTMGYSNEAKFAVLSDPKAKLETEQDIRDSFFNALSKLPKKTIKPKTVNSPKLSPEDYIDDYDYYDDYDPEEFEEDYEQDNGYMDDEDYEE